MNHLHLGVPHRHADGAVSALQHLVRHVEGGARMHVLPVAVLFAGVHVHFVLHGEA
ncbi:MAG: hypothetical protein ACK56I_34495 [bacterium]